MDIKGRITGITYKVSTSETLKIIDIRDFDINESPAFCLVKDGTNSFALSKWVSPKRTRSYPYERVYNTLNSSKKITIIPIVKDEGAKGDRDFIQWDTVSLMSLLDVFVIFAYLCEVEVNGVKMKSKAILKLTSNKIEREISSKNEIWDRGDLMLINNFSREQMLFINDLIDEAEENGFEVKIGGAK